MTRTMTFYKGVYVGVISIPVLVLLVEAVMILPQMNSLPYHVALRCSLYQGGPLLYVRTAQALTFGAIIAASVLYIAFRAFTDRPGLHVAGLVALEGVLVTVLFSIIRCNDGGRWQELDLLVGTTLSVLLSSLVVKIVPLCGNSKRLENRSRE